MIDAAFKILFDVLGSVQRRLSIVMFHRVLGAPDPLLPDETDLALFTRRVRWLARSFEVMTLRDAVDCFAHGRLPRRALVITFDDGYADNAEVALPVLQAAGVAATFFVTTRFLDGGMMWNDRVIEAMRVWPHDTLDLSPFGLAPVAIGSSRHRAVDAVLAQLKYLEFERREAIASRLLADSGSSVAGLMMNAAHIRRLHAAGMEIGAHTHSHPIMRQLEPSAVLEEITRNKRLLEDIIDAPVTSFAYPNGRADQDYGSEHLALLGELGFRCAVTTMPGTARDLAHRYELPRFSPWDRGRARYLARLVLNYFDTPRYAEPAGG